MSQRETRPWLHAHQPMRRRSCRRTFRPLAAHATTAHLRKFFQQFAPIVGPGFRCPQTCMAPRPGRWQAADSPDPPRRYRRWAASPGRSTFSSIQVPSSNSVPRAAVIDRDPRAKSSPRRSNTGCFRGWDALKVSATAARTDSGRCSRGSGYPSLAPPNVDAQMRRAGTRTRAVALGAGIGDRRAETLTRGTGCLRPYAAKQGVLDRRSRDHRASRSISLVPRAVAGVAQERCVLATSLLKPVASSRVMSTLTCWSLLAQRSRAA